MDPLLGNLELDCGENQDDDEEQNRGSGAVLDVALDLVIDVVNDRVEVVGSAAIGGGFAEQADDRGVFLERPDEARDHDVEDLRGKERDGDVHHRLEAARGIDFRGIVILLVDVLETGEENQNLIRQRMPNDIDA